MRLVSDELDAEVLGTSFNDRIEASVFRDGALVAGPLEVSGFSLGWDAGRQVQGQSTLEVADPEGLLAPWGMGDALAPGGSRVHLTWASGSSSLRVPLGVWRIRKSEPDESWMLYGESTVTVQVPDTSTTFTLDDDGSVSVDTDEGTFTVPAAYASVDAEAGTFTVSEFFAVPSGFTEITTTTPARLVHGGGKVTLTIDEDVFATAGMERIDAEAPTAGGSARDALVALVRRFAAVDFTDAPDDVSIPSTYSAYPESRLNAIDDLLDMMQATVRAGSDGSLQVVPREGVGPVWTVAGGDDGVLVKLARAMSDDGVYNAAISYGTTASGRSLVGRAHISAGALKYDGPFGRVDVRHQAVATTQAGVDADAETTLATTVEAGTVDLAVTCLTHFGVQPNDLLTIAAPTTVGAQSLVGRVVGMRVSSVSSDAGTTPAKSMELVVRVSTDDLEAIAAAVRRG